MFISRSVPRSSERRRNSKTQPRVPGRCDGVARIERYDTRPGGSRVSPPSASRNRKVREELHRGLQIAHIEVGGVPSPLVRTEPVQPSHIEVVTLAKAVPGQQELDANREGSVADIALWRRPFRHARVRTRGERLG